MEFLKQKSKQMVFGKCLRSEEPNSFWTERSRICQYSLASRVVAERHQHDHGYLQSLGLDLGPRDPIEMVTNCQVPLGLDSIARERRIGRQ